MNPVFSVVKWLIALPLLWWRCVFVVYALVLLYFTHNPQTTVSTKGVIPLDKQLHIAAFGVWTFLFIFARFGVGKKSSSDQSRPVAPVSYLAIVVYTTIGLLWAGLDEITQSLPGINRNSQWGDWVANAIGVLLAAFFAVIIVLVVKRTSVGKQGSASRRSTLEDSA